MPSVDKVRDRDKRVPDVTVARLSVYARLLATLQSEGWETVSSAMMADRTPYAAAQIRRDLAWFGQLGTRGKGYDIRGLRETLDGILGVDAVRRVALVGVGNLGSALLGYTGFRTRNFRIVAAFDTDMRKVGRTSPDGVRVHSMGELPAVVAEERVEIAILAVPVPAAQSALDAVVDAGIRGVLNFAPTHLQPPPEVRVSTVDLAIEMEGLSYYLGRNAQQG
ncbi:MAG: redox-sensing transcriptional repressor Rex [Candidatus Brocadiia bacterium]|nr:redox-sensing transcriptional repressor Rex [Candidatus Brocadiia bacterium]